MTIKPAESARQSSERRRRLAAALAWVGVSAAEVAQGLEVHRSQLTRWSTLGDMGRVSAESITRVASIISHARGGPALDAAALDLGGPCPCCGQSSARPESVEAQAARLGMTVRVRSVDDIVA